METATISTRGRLVIPTRLRKALHLQAGEKVSLTLDGDKLVLQRAASKSAKLVRGKFGRPVLVAPAGAPEMSPKVIKELRDDYQ